METATTEKESASTSGSGKFENLAGDVVLAKRALEFSKDLHGTLRRKRRPFEDIWAECQEAYRCIERKTFFQGTVPYCSSDLRDAILNIVPQFAKAIWYTDVPFDLVPVGDEGEDDQLADINEKVLAWDFRKLLIYLRYIDSIFQKSIFGTTIVKTPPHFEYITKNLREWNSQKAAGFKTGKKELKRTQELIRQFMGTNFIVTDLFDFWIDPTTISRGMKDPVEYADCIESMIINKSDLLEGKKQGIYTNLDKVEDYYVGAKKTASKEDAGKQRTKNAAKLSQSTSGGDTGTPGSARYQYGNNMYRIEECHAMLDLGKKELERVLITVCAEREVIRLQRWNGDKPYLTSRYTPNGYNREFYGTGIIETNLSNHYERNATRKQAMMARTMGLNMEMLSDQTGFQNRPDKLRTSPNRIHYVRNINGVKPFEKPIGQILQSAIAYETNLKAETQLSTGNTPYIQGAGAQSINDTATGIVALTQAGKEKFLLPIQVDETSLLEPFVKRSLENNVLYRKEDFTIRLTDKKPIRVNPDQLSVNFDVYSKGSVELQNRQIRQVGLEKAWNIAIQAAQMEQMIYGQPLTKFYELKKEIFANLGISNPDAFNIDPSTLQNGGQQTLTAEIEWILIQRMNDGVAPLMPILIQPTEDLKGHYEDHKARRATEIYKRLKPEVKRIWDTHILAYEKALNLIEEQKLEKRAEEEVKGKEVAVGA